MTPDGNGQNVLGVLLEQRRAELAALEATPKAKPPPKAKPKAKSTAAALTGTKKPASGAATPAMPSAKRRKIKSEAEEVIVVE